MSEVPLYSSIHPTAKREFIEHKTSTIFYKEHLRGLLQEPLTTLSLSLTSSLSRISITPAGAISALTLLLRCRLALECCERAKERARERERERERQREERAWRKRVASRQRSAATGVLHSQENTTP